MRQKELRIALVCYGGVSLAVYMHGVTKEIWNLARASRSFHADEKRPDGVQGVYRDLLAHIEHRQQLKLRVLPDIVSGASAGGINAVFLAQAVHSGQSLEPLTEMWLDNADVDRLVDPDARPVWRFAKFWAQPLVWWLLKRPGNAVTESVAKETRSEVRTKVSRLVRGRWFQPPFSGSGFSQMLLDAFRAMEAAPLDAPLLPPGHPVHLSVTTTDFHGHLEMLRLHSPPLVEESEHRLPISFDQETPQNGGTAIANPLELTFAARATASFPGAFPPLRADEIDGIADSYGIDWDGRDAFLERIMPVHAANWRTDGVSLIDGSVLVNKPFDYATQALKGRTSQREVDRRFVYIDPRPDRFGSLEARNAEPVGFFGAIFGSLSTIPREQPIRDNLEALEEQSREAERLQRMISAMRPEIESEVEKLFGRTLFLNRPTPKRLASWRGRAQQAATEGAGFAFHSYAQVKYNRVVDALARTTFAATPELGLPDPLAIAEAFQGELARQGVTNLGDNRGGANPETIRFFQEYDFGFRIRRLRLLVRRLSRDWEEDPEIDHHALDQAREAIYRIISLYETRDTKQVLGTEFAKLANQVLQQPGPVLEILAQRRALPETDEEAEAMMSDALEQMPKNLRRRILLTYLGFPFYDIATLPLMHHDGLTELNPIKVDRISPDDARSIREGGTMATLRGTEFYHFGAFFSRAYRENDYLWGRLHGAERMIDLVCSTTEQMLDQKECRNFKHEAFLAILEQEESRLQADPDLVKKIREEVREQLGKLA